MKHNNKLI